MSILFEFLSMMLILSPLSPQQLPLLSSTLSVPPCMFLCTAHSALSEYSSPSPLPPLPLRKQQQLQQPKSKPQQSQRGSTAAQNSSSSQRTSRRAPLAAAAHRVLTTQLSRKSTAASFPHQCGIGCIRARSQLIMTTTTNHRSCNHHLSNQPRTSPQMLLIMRMKSPSSRAIREGVIGRCRNSGRRR